MTHLPFPEHWGSLKLLPGSTQLLAFTVRSSRSTTSGAVAAPTRSTPAGVHREKSGNHDDGGSKDVDNDDDEGCEDDDDDDYNGDDDDAFIITIIGSYSGSSCVPEEAAGRTAPGRQQPAGTTRWSRCALTNCENHQR